MSIAHTNLNRKRRSKYSVRAAGMSETSVLPYYTKRFGEMVKPYLDKIIEDNTVIATFDFVKLRMSATACYGRIYQGWRWLLDNDDKDGKYKILKASCKIVKGRSTVTVLFDKELKYKPLLGEVSNESQRLGWREQLVQYVEHAPDGSQPLEVTGIPFTTEELDYLVNYLRNFEDSVATIRVTDTSFKICKNSQLAEMVKERMKQKGLRE